MYEVKHLSPFYFFFFMEATIIDLILISIIYVDVLGGMTKFLNRSVKQT